MTSHQTKPTPTLKEALPGLAVLAVLFFVVVSCVGGGDDDKPEESGKAGVTVAAESTADAVAKEEAAAAAAQARKKAAAERQAKIDGAQFATERDLALVFKDPDGHVGEMFQVWGSVTQFDAATGSEAFLASTANRNTTSYGYFDGETAVFSGKKSAFADIVEEDLFTATVEVLGSMSYDTQIGGNTTVPHFTVHKINRQ